MQVTLTLELPRDAHVLAALLATLDVAAPKRSPTEELLDGDDESLEDDNPPPKKRGRKPRAAPQAFEEKAEKELKKETKKEPESTADNHADERKKTQNVISATLVRVGTRATREVLAKFNAARLSDVPPDQWGKLRDALTVAKAAP